MMNQHTGSLRTASGNRNPTMIVVYTDFITVFNAFHTKDHTLEPNAEYTAYPWVLRRSCGQKEWDIIGSGYGFLYTGEVSKDRR